jgi:dihydroorotase
MLALVCCCAGHTRGAAGGCPRSWARGVSGGHSSWSLLISPRALCAGIQAQTAECLVVGEIAAKDLVVALNKVACRGVRHCVCAPIVVMGLHACRVLKLAHSSCWVLALGRPASRVPHTHHHTTDRPAAGGCA